MPEATLLYFPTIKPTYMLKFYTFGLPPATHITNLKSLAIK